MSEAKNEASALDGRAHQSANDSLRETAKWLVVGVFACVSVILAGTSFSSAGELFGETTHWSRIFAALIGGAVGLIGLVRVLLDALRVLTYRQYSLPQFAYGDLNKPDEEPQYNPANFGPIAFPDLFYENQNDFWFPRTSFNVELTRDIRTAINRQFAPHWTEGITCFEDLAKVVLLADMELPKSKDTITGKSITFFAQENSIVARSGGKQAALSGSHPFALSFAKKDTLEVAGKGQNLAFSWIEVADEAGHIHRTPKQDDNGFVISKSMLDAFKHATYNMAWFSRVSLSFERMQRRLPLNVVLIVAGFITMIVALNSIPESTDTQTTTVVETEYSEDGKVVRQTTTQD